MPPIYPSTALKNQQREIKALADNEIVYITENGRGKYLFLSEEVFKQQINDAVEEALYEQRLANALSESRSDFQAGRYYSSLEDLKKGITERRLRNA